MRTAYDVNRFKYVSGCYVPRSGEVNRCFEQVLERAVAVGPGSSGPASRGPHLASSDSRVERPR